jgi:hypothetical protein
MACGITNVSDRHAHRDDVSTRVDPAKGDLKADAKADLKVGLYVLQAVSADKQRRRG